MVQHVAPTPSSTVHETLRHDHHHYRHTPTHSPNRRQTSAAAATTDETTTPEGQQVHVAPGSCNARTTTWAAGVAAEGTKHVGGDDLPPTSCAQPVTESCHNDDDDATQLFWLLVRQSTRNYVETISPVETDKLTDIIILQVWLRHRMSVIICNITN